MFKYINFIKFKDCMCLNKTIKLIIIKNSITISVLKIYVLNNKNYYFKLRKYINKEYVKN